MGVAIEVRKLLRMLVHMVRHDLTWVVGGSGLLLLLVRLAMMRVNKNMVVGKFIRTEVLPQVRSKSFQNLRTLSPLVTPLQRSKSSVVLVSHTPDRAANQAPTHAWLKHTPSTRSLCDTCITHVGSHPSLLNLSDAVTDNMDVETDISSERDTDSDSDREDVRESCPVCERNDASWSFLLFRVWGVACGLTGLYAVWWRFIASRDTALSHTERIVQLLGSLFRYKVVGAHNIPRAGPAVIVVYHGFLPLDMYFFTAFILRTIRRDATIMVADFVFDVPFLSYAVTLGGGVPAGREAAIACLKRGGLLIVSPGGVREAMTTTLEDYTVKWSGRSGFAVVAQLARAPIIPMFSRNIRDLFLVFGGDNAFVARLYRLTKLPFTPFIGPVLLPITSFVGKALPYDAAATTKEVVSRAHTALQSLIDTFKH